MMLLINWGELFINIGFIIIAFLILMFMVTIHELGHYTMGKIFKFKINEFAIGMGPKIFKKKMKSGEDFSIRILPLGGFCAFEGEDEDNTNPMAFNNQKPWKRLIVLFSGALFNFISAILIVIIAFSCFGDRLPAIDFIYETSPNITNEQSFKTGDIILEVDGKTVYLSNDLSGYIKKAEDTMTVVVLRDGQKITLKNIKKASYTVEIEGEVNTHYGWGVRLATTERTKFSFGESIVRSVPYCFRAGGYVLETLGGLVTGLIGIDQIGGPITTIDITSQVARSGFANILFLITLISVNLAVFNLLPLPALDGSRMVFVLIEWIRKKPINRKVEGYIHFFGLVLLFGFVIIIDLINILG